MSKPVTCALLLALIASGCDPTDSKPPEDTGPGIIDADGDSYAEGDDCDDQDPAVFPGAEERCDGVDNDCDGEVDEDASDAASWYADADGDGYGDAEVSTRACQAPSGYAADATDCDDGDAAVNRHRAVQRHRRRLRWRCGRRRCRPGRRPHLVPG